MPLLSHTAGALTTVDSVLDFIAGSPHIREPLREGINVEMHVGLERLLEIAPGRH